jgi:L-alanine-DL-glutamate epimerase-like enolase superfamily enzyme
MRIVAADVWKVVVPTVPGAVNSPEFGPDPVGSWVRQDDLIVEPLRFESGYAIVPDRPGLGCALDLAAIEKYQVP